MLSNEIKIVTYEKYQLYWMLSHNKGLTDLLMILKSSLKEMPDELSLDEKLCQALENLNECGFDGEIYSCYREFLTNEYHDRRFIKKLLNPEEYKKYLLDLKQAA